LTSAPIRLAGRPVFPMAASSNKIPLTLAPVLPLASGSIKLASPHLVPPVTKVDFAANPNHYRTNGNGKVRKAKPQPGPRADQSPRLSLNIQCDALQEQDAGMEWRLSDPPDIRS
jgi:hypothetical protein